jgi:hypothetical protein
MRDKILQEVIEWCEKQEEKPNLDMENFVDMVIDKTTNYLLERIKTELKNEFETGNLKHGLTISNDYYLYLKMKDLKNGFIKQEKDEDFTENDEIKEKK